MTSSGFPIWNNADPPAPGCFPGRRALRRRVAREGGVAGPSAGGCDELPELRPSCRSNSAIRWSWVVIRAVSSSITRACCSTSARSSSRDGCSDPDTAHDQHTALLGSRTRRKITEPGPEWLRPDGERIQAWHVDGFRDIEPGATLALHRTAKLARLPGGRNISVLVT
jgi:hypothetical protein